MHILERFFLSFPLEKIYLKIVEISEIQKILQQKVCLIWQHKRANCFIFEHILNFLMKFEQVNQKLL